MQAGGEAGPGLGRRRRHRHGANDLAAPTSRPASGEEAAPTSDAEKLTVLKQQAESLSQALAQLNARIREAQESKEPGGKDRR